MSTDMDLLELIAAQVGKLTIDMDEVKKRITNLDNITLKIEREHGNKLDALLDGYKQLAESQTEMKSDISEMKSDINDIKTRQEAQEVEIRVIKGGKSKKVK
jgi:TolA-binding protein